MIGGNTSRCYKKPEAQKFKSLPVNLLNPLLLSEKMRTRQISYYKPSDKSLCIGMYYCWPAKPCPILWDPHRQQYANLPCASLSPRVCSSPCPLSRWYHPTISSSVTLFSSYPQSFLAPGPFSVSWLFPSGGQRTGASASASVPPMNIQDWFPLGWTGWISLQSKGLSRVFSNTTAQKHHFFSAQPSLWSNYHICTWPMEKP